MNGEVVDLMNRGGTGHTGLMSGKVVDSMIAEVD